MNTYTEIINGIKYNIKVKKVLYFQSRVLWKALNELPVSKLRDNFKLEIGFSIFILKKCESKDEYNILAPDYTGSPFLETTDDLSLAFLIQLEQIRTLQKYNIAGSSIRFDDEIVVAKDALKKQTICLQRFSDLSGSGWCINEIRKDNENYFINVESKEYEMIYAYQLLSIRPSILDVLLLPYDYIVVFDDDKCVEILNEKNESLITNDKHEGLNED